MSPEMRKTKEKAKERNTEKHLFVSDRNKFRVIRKK